MGIFGLRLRGVDCRIRFDTVRPFSSRNVLIACAVWVRAVVGLGVAVLRGSGQKDASQRVFCLRRALGRCVDPECRITELHCTHLAVAFPNYSLKLG